MIRLSIETALRSYVVWYWDASGFKDPKILVVDAWGICSVQSGFMMEARGVHSLKRTNSAGFHAYTEGV